MNFQSKQKAFPHQQKTGDAFERCWILFYFFNFPFLWLVIKIDSICGFERYGGVLPKWTIFNKLRKEKKKASLMVNW